MKISSHVSNLLKKKNCVIVPEFGGFLKKEQPAMFGPKKQDLFPPSSQLVFQRNLQQNDGLLIRHIIREEAINELDATKRVEQFAQKANESLEKSKSFVVDGVGKIYVDSEEQFVFKPFQNVNYNQKSFGLPTLSPAVINRLEQKEEEVQQLIDKRKQLSPITMAFTVAASFLTLLLAGSLYFLNEGTPQEKELVQNTLSPFVYTKNAKQGQEIQKETASYKEATIAMNASAENETISVAKTDLVKTPSYKNVTQDEADFHVIVGVFFQESHAKKVQEKAKEKGYFSEVKKGRKYYRVSVPFSAEKETWMSAQKEMSNQIATDAWVWESRLK